MQQEKIVENLKNKYFCANFFHFEIFGFVSLILALDDINKHLITTANTNAYRFLKKKNE